MKVALHKRRQIWVMASGKVVVAAAFLIFRRLGAKIQYLLLQTSYGEHHWTPPKGELYIRF